MGRYVRRPLRRDTIRLDPLRHIVRRSVSGRRHYGRRLQGQSQVVACLGAIDEAIQRLSGAPDVALTVLDGSGHCLVAGVTAQSILALWQEIVSGRDTVRLGADGVVPPGVVPPSFQAPYTTSTSASSGGGPQQADAAA